MKIIIIAIGTRGDIQPCVALAKELISNNIDVLVSTFNEYKELVNSNLIPFIEMPANPANKDKDDNNIKLKSYEDYLKVWLERCLTICKDSDAIIYTPPFIIGTHLAEKLAIPYFPINYAPSIITKYFPTPYLNLVKSIGQINNKLTHTFVNNYFWLTKRKMFNRLRTNTLNLTPLSFANPYQKMFNNKAPYLCCFSPNIIKRPSDWYSQIQVHGYWYLDNDINYKTTSSLLDFLNAGDKPIYIDFGSYSNKISKNKIELILNDLDESDERFLIDVGRIAIDNFKFPQKCFLIKEFVPHKWLLPKVKAIIVHGGVGVIHAAAIAGVPTIPISIIKPQIFWGKKHSHLKLGTIPIEIKKIRKGDLLNSIKYLNNNSEVSLNATKLKGKIIEEKGTKKTVKFIITYMKNNKEN